MATWETLLAEPEEVVIPWLGGKKITRGDRTWNLKRTPREYGWYRFSIDGSRRARLLGPTTVDPSFEEDHPLVRGYIVGNRLIPDGARVPTPDKFAQETLRVFLIEEGLSRVERGVAAKLSDGRLVFLTTEFPLGPEDAVIRAYEDRKDSVDDVPEVSPALDLAFRWMTQQREFEEEQERLREAERLQRIEEEARRARMEEAFKAAGTGQGRRELAAVDFKAACRAALMISGAELLDTRVVDRTRVEVMYRFRHERLACVVDRRTLQVLDAGICLTDHNTGEKGDRYFTLESLPAVVSEAIDQGVLVIWRH
jgi:hypothetical protein